MVEQEPQLQITDEEKKQLIGFFEKLDTATLKATAEAISMFVRAFEGRPLGDEDVITRLINVKNKMETSRFPTYPLLGKQVYLRLIAKYNPQADACKAWADIEAEALKAYKGLNWDAYVEMSKGQMQAQQEFYLGIPPGSRRTAPVESETPVEGKRHFWQGKPKKQEQSEFISE